MKRFLKPVLILLTAIYFTVDALFMIFAKPIANWFATHWMFTRLRNWIVSLRPYPTLLLFAVPLILLEPVKPVALYLAATGHVRMSIAVLVIGEILKLVIVEHLFSITKDKLMSIPAFRWAYLKYACARDWVMSSDAWQTMLRWTRIAKVTVRRYAVGLRVGQRQREISLQR